MSHSPAVVSVNVSPGGIPKRPVDEAEVVFDGLAGDGHNHEKHRSLRQAVSLLDVEDLEDLRAEGFDVGPGAAGENLTVRGLDVDRLAPGETLRLSGGVELEITKVRRPCYVLDAISPELKVRIEGRCGVYARVIRGGRVRAGETIHVEHGAAATT